MTCRVDWDEDNNRDLIKKVALFTLYSIALDESNDKDSAQLLIFIRRINNTFEITEEFLTMEYLKGQTRGEDLFDQVSVVIENMYLPWSYNVTYQRHNRWISKFNWEKPWPGEKNPE